MMPNVNSGASTNRRVLIIGADGLRPDLLDASQMPNVTALAASGVRFSDHHAVYPSHTRVNMSSLTTGTSPGRHGIVANTMLVPNARPDHIIDTGNYQHLDALDAASGGNALFVPALDDVLAPRGARVAVAGTGTSGSNLLWTRNHRSRIVNTNSAYGIADLYDLREKLGEIPEPAIPNLARLDYATRAVTDIYLDDPQNRVIILWLAEPDSSLHRFGLGSPESIAAMRSVDECVGRILDALDRAGTRDQFDIFFISDHGHSTVQAHNTIRDHLIEAAAELGHHLPQLSSASDFIYSTPGVPEPSVDRLAPLVEWLYSQPWCDLVLSGQEGWATLPGALPLNQLWNDATNPRRPLLAVSPAWSDATNEFGVPGTVSSLTTQSAMKSSHGSASPFDMHALMIASGPSFREGVVSDTPTGAIDLAPTVLTLLGIEIDHPVDGRVLREGLAATNGETSRDQTDIILEPALAAPHGRLPRVRLHQVGNAQYAHGSI
jgi:predicted AlkP superfamily pyrophosphatase or phosphodiesterase